MSPLSIALASSPTFIMIKPGCPFCSKAIGILDSKKVDYKVFEHTKDSELDKEITKATGHKTYPKIYLNKRFIGGCSELIAHFDKPKTDLL